jgi:hypothetical protein
MSIFAPHNIELMNEDDVSGELIRPLWSLNKRIIDKHTLGFSHGITHHLIISKLGWGLRATQRRQLAQPYLPASERML